MYVIHLADRILPFRVVRYGKYGKVLSYHLWRSQAEHQLHWYRQNQGAEND